MIGIKEILNKHIYELSKVIGCRPIGTLNNKKAEKYIYKIFENLKYRTQTQTFNCLSWNLKKTELFIDREQIDAVANTYSNSYNVKATFLSVGTIFELQKGDFKDKIAVLYGELTQEILAAKNNHTYNPEKHKKIVNLLEEKAPLAIITISHKMLNPLSIIEDWDFKIPSVTISAANGMKLLKRKKGIIKLSIESSFKKSNGSNVIGRSSKGGKKKIVLCAHYDTKYGTNGAADNAAGVSALLTIAQILKDEKLPIDIEFVAFNGEEYYGIGEDLYIEKRNNYFKDVIAAINIDGIGHYSSVSNVAFFEWPKKFIDSALALKDKYSGIIEVEPWPASDHYLFWIRKIQCIAVSSKGTIDIFHTMNDNNDFICSDKILEVVRFVVDLIKLISRKNY